MSTSIQFLEQEIQRLKTRIFFSEAVVWIDTLIVSALIYFYILSSLEIIYITNEDKIRLTTLILIGFVRATTVHIANDAHFSEDLKFKKIEYEKVIAFNKEYQKPEELYEKILINVLAKIISFGIQLLKTFVNFLTKLSLLIDSTAGYEVKIGSSPQKITKNQAVVSNLERGQNKQLQKLEEEIQVIKTEVVFIRCLIVSGIILTIIPVKFFLEDNNISWLFLSLFSIVIKLWIFREHKYYFKKLKERQLEHENLQNSFLGSVRET